MIDLVVYVLFGCGGVSLTANSAEDMGVIDNPSSATNDGTARCRIYGTWLCMGKYFPIFFFHLFFDTLILAVPLFPNK